MKKLFLIAAVCFVAKTSLAQFNTHLVISPNPRGTLLEWSAKDLTYFISAINGSAGKVLVKATLKTTDGTVAAASNLAKARVFSIFPPIVDLILYAADVIPLETMVFNGKFKTSMEKSGKLPAGSYMLCVQLVRPVDFTPLSLEQCSFFTVAAFQLPIPMMPANETILDIEKAKAAITFRWTPVAPRPAEMLTYRVGVFEILPNQTPKQALRSNQPLLVKDIVGTTQFIWQPQLGLTGIITGYDESGLKVLKDSGDYRNRRQPITFQVQGERMNNDSTKKDSGDYRNRRQPITFQVQGERMNNDSTKKDSGDYRNRRQPITFQVQGERMNNDSTKKDSGDYRNRRQPITFQVQGERMNNDSTKIPTPEPDMDPDAYAFIWTIQTLDSHGAPFGDGNINGDGISEPNVFYIDRRPPAMRKSGPPSRVSNPNGKRN